VESKTDTSPPSNNTLRTSLTNILDRYNDGEDGIHTTVDEILAVVGAELRREHKMFRTYNPITLIEWLESR
jgi:hypothetical protein